MAKQPEQPAGGFETENTGGVLSGLLAEEDVFDRRTLWRLGSWAAGSVAAVIVALYASQSSMSLRREQLAASDVARQGQQIQSLTKESQNETRRLASAIETLNGDRDRLYSRVTVLEQGLDSVTGAIAKQAAAPAPPPPAVAAIPAIPEPHTAAQNATPAPVLAPVATTVAKVTDKPAVDKTSSPPASAVATTAAKATDKPPADKSAVTQAMASVAPPVAKNLEIAKSTDRPPTDKTTPEPAPATVSSVAPNAPPPPSPMPAPLVATKSIMAPPDAAATKLIEPEKLVSAVTSAPLSAVIAAAPPAEVAEPDAAQAEPPKLSIQRTDFGVDLGGANSVGGLRALWRGLLKAKSNAALTTLRPIIVIREGSIGLGMQLRLVAGPLSDAAAAAKICASLVESDRTCETTVFDGQRLAVKIDEPAGVVAPATAAVPEAPEAKPASSHRRGAAKRATVEQPEKKPDAPSVLSTFFSRR